ncbi:hypothetical protein B0H11DRAFT_2250236 [Mycena galericulata]|nr:hypothetical protein B0H11DRAFT_2250236 [Mycena galericulata]
MRIFFCKYNDPLYVKIDLEKLDIKVRLAAEGNADALPSELKGECAFEVNIDFVRKSIKAIGQTATLKAVVELFLKKPDSAQAIVQRMLNTATNCDSLDVRDGAYIYWWLMLTDPGAATVPLCRRIGHRSRFRGRRLQRGFLRSCSGEISTFASVYHKPEETFVGRGRIGVDSERKTGEAECVALCTAYLEEMPSSENQCIQGVDSAWRQFHLMISVGAPDAEAKFQKGLPWSGLHNWHSFIRHGLWYKVVANGGAFGDGVYLATDAHTAMGHYAAGGHA